VYPPAPQTEPHVQVRGKRFEILHGYTFTPLDEVGSPFNVAENLAMSGLFNHVKVFLFVSCKDAKGSSIQICFDTCHIEIKRRWEKGGILVILWGDGRPVLFSA